MKLIRAIASLSLLALMASCGLGGPDIPSREEVLPLLEQEARSMKIEGEDINPRLEVDMTWTIDGIEIRERPDDEKHPWAGAVDITIISKIKELDGYITEETKKTFRYVWDMEIQKWVIE